jgi:hypothetical protein
MKELIDKLLVAIPAYAHQMIDLLRNPREFVFQSLDPALSQQMLRGVMPDPVDLMKSTGYKAFWALLRRLCRHLCLDFSHLEQLPRTQPGFPDAFDRRFRYLRILLRPLAIGLQFLMASSLSSSAPAAFPPNSQVSGSS